MATKATKPASTTAPAISESVQRMLAYGAAHRHDPIPPRTETFMAYDHPVIYKTRGKEFANETDRVRLCAPDKPCAMCLARIRLAKGGAGA